ncbi:hypothetical protein E4U34_002376, partial [Claviceps purpurea]
MVVCIEIGGFGCFWRNVIGRKVNRIVEKKLLRLRRDPCFRSSGLRLRRLLACFDFPAVVLVAGPLLRGL